MRAVSLIALALSVATASAATINLIEPRSGSVLGETRLTIGGTGFDLRGRSNDVFIGTGLNGVFCDPVPNECTETRIVCLTEKYQGGPPLPLSVRSFGYVADCQMTSGCTFEFTHEKTPSVTSVSPQWAVADQILTFSGSNFNQGDPTVANFDFTAFLGEEERCELIGQVSSSSFRCRLYSMRPGALKVDVIMGAFGRASLSRNARTVTIYPELQGVSPATGSMAGGTLLTVTATSLSPELVDNMVLVHGKPCVVQSVNEDQLTCLTAPNMETSVPPRMWQAGKQRVNIWYDVPGGSISSNWHNLIRYNQVSSTQMRSGFGLGSLSCSNCALSFTTHFVAPATGEFTFDASGDDQYELWLSEDEEPIIRRQALPENSSNVLDVTPYHPLRCIYGASWNSNPNPCRRSMVQGQKYWMRGILKQGSGGIGFAATVTGPNGEAVNLADNIAYSEDWVPPVELVVKDTPAKLADTCIGHGTCNFDYTIANTPTVTGVTATAAPGELLTITGTNFDTSASAPASAPTTCADLPQCGGGGCACSTQAECALHDDQCSWSAVNGACQHTTAPPCDTWSRNRVTVGGTECQVTSNTATQLICRLGFTQGAGSFPVVVRAGATGVAAGSPLTTITTTIRKLNPEAGSLNGANSLTILGHGFDAEDGVTSVTIGGNDCPVQSITSYQIVCRIPAGTEGNAAVSVDTKDRVANTAAYSYTYDTPMARPGTTQFGGNIVVQPRRSSMSGGSDIRITIPSINIASTSLVRVTFGDSPCDVNFALNNFVSCRTNAVATVRTVAGSITVTHTDGTTVTETLPSISFVRSATGIRGNSVSPVGSSHIDVWYDGHAVPPSAVSVAAFGSPCLWTQHWTGRVRCHVGPQPTRMPALPAVETFDFTSPEGSFTNPLHRMDYSTGVSPNSDGSVNVPGGSHWFMSKRQLQRPFVFKAKVRTTRDTGARVTMRVCVGENAMSSSGYRANVWHDGQGRFSIQSNSRTWRTSLAQFAQDTKFAAIGLDSTAYHDYKIVADRQFISFYIDDVLVQVVSDRSATIGSIGFGHSSQTIRVKDFVVEDLYPNSLQVNVSGTPLYNNYDIRYGSAPVVTRYRSTNIAMGMTLTIFGSNFGGSATVYAVDAEDSQITRTSPKVCDGSVRRAQTGAYYVTCEVGSVPAGTWYLAYRSDLGMATNRVRATVSPVVTEVSPATCASEGRLITISGGGFKSTATVTVGGNACPVLSSNSRQIVCMAPAGSGNNRAIAITVESQRATVCSECHLSYSGTLAEITAVSTNTGGDGTVITFTGTNFEATGNLWVRAGDVNCADWRRTETEIRCTMERSASNGEVPLVVHFPASGKAKFADGVTSTFTFVTQATSSNPRTGSTRGGQTLRVDASGLNTGRDVSRVARHTFTTLEEGWTNAPDSLWTCSGEPMLGPIQYDDVARTFTGLGSHTALRVAYDVMLVSSTVKINIDGRTYTIERTSCEYGWTCGSSWAWTCRAKGSITVAHTAASATVSFESHSAHHWGIISYDIGTLSGFQAAVTVGGSACDVTMLSESNVWCTTPAGTGADQAVALTQTGSSNNLCTSTSCVFSYDADSTPTVTGVANSELPIPAAVKRVTPQIATRGGIKASYSANGAKVWKVEGSANNWDNVASSPLAIAQPTTGTDGIAFTATAVCWSMFGLSTRKMNDGNNNYVQIDYAIYLRGDSRVEIYEQGSGRGHVAYYSKGDNFAVYYDAACNCVKYARNGGTIYQSDRRVDFPLYQSGTIKNPNCMAIDHLKFLQERTESHRLVMKGSGLATSLGAVTFNNEPCVDSYVSNGVANCWVAAVPTATFTVVPTSALGLGSESSLSLTDFTFSRASDSTGSTEGGHVVTILGTAFSSATTVMMGTSSCDVTSVSATQLVCRTTAGVAGTVSIVVTTGSDTHNCFPYMGVIGGTQSACDYTYGATTAAVTGVSGTQAAGAQITVTGTNFPSDAWVELGTNGCARNSRNATTITCTIGNSVPAGTYNVRVVSRSSGYSTTDQNVQIPLTVSSISTTAIGAAGGAHIVIDGANFGTDGNGELTLMAGSTAACASISRTPTRIVCEAAAFESSGALVLSVNGQTVNAADSFTASAANAPAVTSVQPTSGAAGSAITATGTNLEGSGSILVGGIACEVYVSTATQASCILSNGAAVGSQAVSVRTDNRGTGSGSATFEVRLSVYAVVPPFGPNAGGRVVTVNGAGFSTDATKMRVRIAGAACEISSSAATAIVCTTGMVPEDNDRTDVQVAFIDEAQVANTASSTQYNYNTDLTATIASVSPTSGSAAGMQTLTIEGTGFSTQPLDNVVKIGGIVCSVDSASETSLTCLTQVMPSGDHTIDVIVRGQGRASGAVTYSAALQIDSLSGSSFSVEGGALLTMTGSGFWVFSDASSWRHGYYNVTVGGQECAVRSSTATAVVCQLPAARRPFVGMSTLVSEYPLKPEASDVTIAAIVNGRAATVAAAAVVNYAHAETPRVTNVSPTGIVAPGTTVTLTGTGFATSGNEVWIGSNITCNVQTESATSITCTIATGRLGSGFIRVNVPGKGYSTAQLSCPAGQFLMCDGKCVGNSQCVYEEWGMASCEDLTHLIIHDTFCHSNGGTDRVNIPFKTDSETVFNLNCPMYSCEGGDCDTALYIGGRGGRVSTCGADPSGHVLDVRPTLQSLSASSSSIGGGRVITMTGAHFGTDMSKVVAMTNGAVCAVSSLTDTQIVCETGVGVRSTSQAIVYVDGVQSICTGTCTFSYVDAGIPVVSETSPRYPRHGQPLTITGENFGTDANAVSVHIGQRVCAVTEVTATSVVCTAPQLPIGTRSLRVTVASIGSSFGATIVYRLYVRTVSADRGSQRGGHQITVGGSGFSSNTRVRLGSCATDFVSLTNDALVVRTRNCTGSQRVSAFQGSQTSQCDNGCRSYNFASGSTPEITSSNINGNTVTLAVSNLNGAEQADVTVSAGGATCAITSYSATSITCTMGATNAGQYAIMVHDANQGYGPSPADSNPTFTFSSSITSFTPTSGARGGDQTVTISGSGFGTSASNARVNFGAAVCAIQTIADNEIVCKTVQSDESGAVAVTVTSVDDRMMDATAPVATASGTYTYDANSPVIYSVAPDRGSTAGGTRVTIGGRDLSTSLTVTFDGIVCEQSQADRDSTTSTFYLCTTGRRDATNLEPVPAKGALPNNGGLAWTNGTYQYIDLWSRWTTWGGSPPPIEGDSAVISEGQAVMVDYNPPRFYLIIVMGHLIFDPTRDINLDCTYIMINFGRFTIGTAEKPYLKRAVITLYGDRLTPEIPVHGAKVIALRHGVIDMHGETRQPTHTQLAATANAGSSSIQVRGPVDWRVGEFIVVAPTDYEFLHAEHRMITGVSPADGQADVVTIQLEYPLEVMHFGERQCFGTGADEVCVDEIAEVGLLTRNILVKGDRNSMRIGFGGTMFIMPLGHDDTHYARISHVEFAQVGQQFIVGRYPVHYHVTHTINNSYVNGTSVHESLNRAFSIHGVHNMTYVNNVAYDIFGHAFFIEDGSERHNLIENNMVSVVKSTTSNLNTDVTPANFWLVSPTNILRNNHACGGHAYGYWISPFHPHSTGPTSSPNDCPASHPLAEFSGNTAHSNRKYGLNIFRFWWPKEEECNFNSRDVPAYIRNQLSYKNHIHGITMGNQEAGEVGSIIIDNYTGADNGRVHGDGSAYWIEKNRCANMTIGVQNSVLIALTNNQPFRRRKARRGINLPEGDNFFTENVTFVNYDRENFGFEPQAWAARMSLCFPWGWEAVSRGLKWIDSPQRIRMRFHHHGVLADDDGTLTGTAGSQVIAKSPLFDDSICETVARGAPFLSEALVCPNHYKIRRFGISSMNEIFSWQLFKNGPHHEEVPEILRGYLVTAPINHSIQIDFQWWKNPAQWDWKFGAFKFLQPGEHQLFWTIYNETRHHVYATFSRTGLNKTWWGPEPQLSDTESAYNFDNETMKFAGHIVYPENTGMRVNAFYCPDEGCPLPPLPPAAWDAPCTSFTNPNSWNGQPSGRAVPAPGSELFIRTSESVCMDGLAAPNTDVPPPPPAPAQDGSAGGPTNFAGVQCAAGREYEYNFFSLRIEGSLQLFDHHCPCEGAIVKLKVQSNVWIRNGGLLIGNSTHPLTRCKFCLEIGAPPLGDVTRMGQYRLDPWEFRSLTLESGMLRMYGAAPQPLWARLAQPATSGANTITLDQPVDWQVGAKIAIAGTTRLPMFYESKDANDALEESEPHFIAAVSDDRRTITLTAPLAHAHFGGAPQTLSERTYNIGAEVIIFDRNVCINGGELSADVEGRYSMGWKLNAGCTGLNHEGCAIGEDGAVGWPMTGAQKPGYLQLNGVKMSNMGQAADIHGSMELDGLVGRSEDAAESFVRNCAFDTVFNTGIFIRDSTNGMTIQNNTFFNVSGDAIRVASSGNTIDGNVVVRSNMPIQVCDKVYFIFWDCRTAGVRAHSGNRVINNVIASGFTAGFITDGDMCNDGAMRWSNNMVHSTRDGLLVNDKPAEKNMNWLSDSTTPSGCRHVGGVTAYWIGDHGLVNWYSAGDFKVTDLTVVEATVGTMAILIYPPANIVGNTIPTASYTNVRFAGFWNGQQCRSSDYKWKCKKSLLDSAPWCKMLYFQHQQHIGTSGLGETLFTSSEYGMGKTKGEQKFRWQEMDSYSTVGGQVTVENVHFANFDGDDSCGLKNIAFHQNPYSNDTFHQHTFSQVTWSNIEDGGEFYAHSTYGDAHKQADDFTPTWFLDYDNFKYGAYWPDSPNHQMIKDLDGSFTGTGSRSTIVASQSLIRSDTFDRLAYDGRAFRAGNLGPQVSGCTERTEWNAFLCDSTHNFMTVVIDNLAEDRLTRRPGPVVMCKGDGMIDVNGWPLCQGGQVQYASGPVMKGKAQRATLERMTRYWFHAEHDGNMTLSFRGAPPDNMRFYLQDHEWLGMGNNVGVTLNLRFHGENSQLRMGIYVDGVRQRPSVGYGYPDVWPHAGQPAGTHYHDKFVDSTIYTRIGNQGFQRNVLSFVLRPGSVVDIRAEPIVQVTANLAMPLDEFFNNKETFPAAMAHTLGIPADRIKFAKIVPGTTRRQGQSSTTEVTVDVSPSDGAITGASGLALAELEGLRNSVQQLTANGSITVTDPASGQAYTATSMNAQVAQVAVSVPQVTVAPGTPYILMNFTKNTGAMNTTLVAQTIAEYARSTMNNTVDTAYGAIVDDEVVATNEFTDDAGFTRVTILMLMENATLNEDGLQHIYDILNNASTSGRILPGYAIHSIEYSNNAEAASTGSDLWSVEGSVLKFAVGVAVGLVVVLAIGFSVMYCCIFKRTAKHADREAKKVDKFDTPHQAPMSPPTHQSTHPDEFALEEGRAGVPNQNESDYAAGN